MFLVTALEGVFRYPTVLKAIANIATGLPHWAIVFIYSTPHFTKMTAFETSRSKNAQVAESSFSRWLIQLKKILALLPLPDLALVGSLILRSLSQIA
jgi:hypothetical protein